jgi:two-component system, chemotaxis family, response regulator Rcp1
LGERLPTAPAAISAASKRPLRILAVDDSTADLVLLEEAISQHGIDAELERAHDGDEALVKLRDGSDRPDIMLLDLNMPRRHGREVLAEVKRDPDLRSIPVIIFSTSSSPADIAACYDDHANSYVVKPVDFDGLGRVVDALDAFWVHHAKLPGYPR